LVINLQMRSLICEEINLPIIIDHMHQDDVEVVAKIHSQQFPRQHSSSAWINCNFAAFPRIMLFVARNEKDHVVGYIQWIQKSGFRAQTVIELEQIAVLTSYQHKGIGTQLIKESLSQIQIYLDDSNSKLKAILVSTRSDNRAKALYEKILGAKEVVVIKDLYSSDEVLMLALQM
jgi:ribosomal protein S18 acetylase RimI-like enzyme